MLGQGGGSKKVFKNSVLLHLETEIRQTFFNFCTKIRSVFHIFAARILVFGNGRPDSDYISGYNSGDNSVYKIAYKSVDNTFYNSAYKTTIMLFSTIRLTIELTTGLQ